MTSPLLKDAAIADSVVAFFRQSGGVERVRTLCGGTGHLDAKLWRSAAEQGWIAMLAAEEAGGLGLGIAEAATVCQTIGIFAAPDPFASAMAVSRCLAAIAPGHPVTAAHLGGESCVVPAFTESCGGNEAGIVVPDLLAADRVLVVESAGDNTRIGLATLGESDMTTTVRRTVDGGSTGRLSVGDTIGEILAQGEQAARAADELRATLAHLRAAELSGIAMQAQRLAIDYLATREQFGVPLASFQALQHRAATLYVRTCALDALVFEATRAGTPGEHVFAALAALETGVETALFVCKEAIQMHGAIGFADETVIGLYLKRAMAIAASERGGSAIISTATQARLALDGEQAGGNRRHR